MIFYPYFNLGEGYIIPSNAEYRRLFQNYRTVFIIILFLILTFLVLTVLDPWAGLLLLCTTILIYVIYSRIQCRDLESTEKYVEANYAVPKTNRKHTFLTRTIGKYIEPGLILLSGLLAILFSIGHAYFSIGEITAAWIAFLAACTTPLTRYAIEKWRKRRKQS